MRRFKKNSVKLRNPASQFLVEGFKSFRALVAKAIKNACQLSTITLQFHQWLELHGTSNCIRIQRENADSIECPDYS